jgi:hypothetical protein
MGGDSSRHVNADGPDLALPVGGFHGRKS